MMDEHEEAVALQDMAAEAHRAMVRRRNSARGRMFALGHACDLQETSRDRYRLSRMFTVSPEIGRAFELQERSRKQYKLARLNRMAAEWEGPIGRVLLLSLARERQARGSILALESRIRLSKLAPQ